MAHFPEPEPQTLPRSETPSSFLLCRRKAGSASIIVPKDARPNFVSSHGKTSPFSRGPTAGFLYS